MEETLAERLRGSMCSGDRGKAADRIEELEAAVVKFWFRVDECEGYSDEPSYKCIKKGMENLFDVMPNIGK